MCGVIIVIVIITCESTAVVAVEGSSSYLGGLTALNCVAESRRPSLVRRAVNALGPSKSLSSSSIPLPPCHTRPT